MALFNYCNGLVGRRRVGCALRCPQARLSPHPVRAQTGVGGGGGGFQPGLAVRAQNIGLLAQVLADALFARPPPALPRPGISPLLAQNAIWVHYLWARFV